MLEQFIVDVPALTVALVLVGIFQALLDDIVTVEAFKFIVLVLLELELKIPQVTA